VNFDIAKNIDQT